ncbi:MAG TPA: ribbon-helix-helix protein, CopG family [Vicinamibacterales bacterium]|nr:ribbon-helix-helix protein, CopG family [Vicinamibacterales bacterium]
MVRKQLYIERRHDERLKQYARASGRSQAEVVREAVEQYAVQNRAELLPDNRAWAEALAFMRSLRARRGRRRLAAVPRERIYEEGMARRGSRAR